MQFNKNIFYYALGKFMPRKVGSCSRCLAVRNCFLLLPPASDKYRNRNVRIYTMHSIIFIFFLALPYLTFSQKETSKRAQYAPWGEKHANVSDEKGKQGEWKFYTDDKILLYDITYKNDIKHGPCSKYYSSNGIIREESNYYYGKKDGDYKGYYINGEIHAEGTYKDGKRSGAWIIYYKSSGEKKIEGTYINGKKDGVWIYYDVKGVKSVQGKYLMDVKEGDWETYDSDGKVIEVKKYINGVLQLKEGVKKQQLPVKKTSKTISKTTTTKPTSPGTDSNNKTNTNNQSPSNEGAKDEKKIEKPGDN